MVERVVKVQQVKTKTEKTSRDTTGIVQPVEVPDNSFMKNSSKVIIAVYVFVIILGIGTGYLLSSKAGGAGLSSGPTPAVVKTGNTVGSTDTQTFKDSADGTLQAGGSGGEGSFHLDRTGGVSQTVYLISSVVDLNQFVGKHVKVWGQTMAAQNVAWLMDVGKVELLSK